MRGDVGDVGDLQPHADGDRALRQPLDPAVVPQVHAAGELRQRRRRQVVRLVEHQQAVVQLGQQPVAQRRQQQIVVDHDDLRADQRLAALVVGAAVECRTVLAGAGGRVGRHGRPDLVRGGRVERVAVAVPGATGQRLRDAAIELQARRDLVLGPGRARGGLVVGEQVGGGVVRVVGVAIGPDGLAGQPRQLELADIAPAPLGQREAERLRQQRGQGRQVLGDQLLLQRDGGGGDDDARVARQRQRDGGRAVGERLAHAGAGLDHGDGAHRVGGIGGVAVGVGLRLLELAQCRRGQRGGHPLGHAPLAVAAPQAAAGAHRVVEGLQRGRGQRGGGGIEVGPGGGNGGRMREGGGGGRDGRRGHPSSLARLAGRPGRGGTRWIAQAGCAAAAEAGSPKMASNAQLKTKV